MIITKKKPEETIDAMIAPFPKLSVVGCGTCSTKCMSGGEEQCETGEMDLTRSGEDALQGRGGDRRRGTRRIQE